MSKFKKYGKYSILFSASILLFALALISYLGNPSEDLVTSFLVLMGVALIVEECVRPHIRHKGKGKH